MRELSLNGYIDDEVWYGDEITPESLHESLYGPNNENSDDVHIRLNSFGGSCNAAVRMFDDIRAYPGRVSITVSGTAASAATILCMAADRLEITPGSLFMIHDPILMVFGNEKDLTDAILLLRTCKDSILNMYERRVRTPRSDVSDMMTASTWMDANDAFERGFVDAIADDPLKYPADSAEERTACIRTAEERVNAWIDRKKTVKRPEAAAKPSAEVDQEESMPAQKAEESEKAGETPEIKAEPAASEPETVRIDRIDLRLNDLKY